MQLQVQISSKSKAFARFFMNAIINYGSNGYSLVQANNGKIGAETFENPPLMKGMKAILDEEVGNADDINHPFFNNGDATQTIELIEDDGGARDGKPGRTFGLEDLDALLDAVTKGPEFMLMNKKMRRVLRVLLRNTGGGTDAAQVMRQDLGSGKPLLHYQEIPVFISDFVSDVEPVHQLHSTAVTIDSMNVGAGTVTLSADISAQITAALSGIKAVSDGIYLVARSGVAGKFRKIVLKVTAVSGATLTYDKTFKIKDDELNKLQLSSDVVMTPLAAGLTGLIGKSAAIYERVDGTSIYAGKFGEQEGFCAFTLMNNAGIQVKYVGPSREKDEQQYRINALSC